MLGLMDLVEPDLERRSLLKILGLCFGNFLAHLVRRCRRDDAYKAARKILAFMLQRKFVRM